MAISSKITYHSRSISLPTRSNALTLTVEEQLCRVRSSELATSSSRSISQSLTGLKDLYESVDDFLHLQPIQQESCLDSVLDRFLLLLDACGSTRDVLSQMKRCVQDLQSSIRRKRCGELGLAVELKEYMSSRKKVTKMIRKCLKGLKKMQYKNSDKVAIVNMLREVEEKPGDIGDDKGKIPPRDNQVEEHLCQLRSSGLATSSSSSSISNNLNSLKNFTTRDVLSQMRECVQDLQSSIRRRRGEDLDLAKELDEYMTSRKKVTKVIRKCLGGLKKMQSRNYDDVAVVNVLKEVEAATLAVFQSLLAFLCGPKQSNWSLVSRLLPSKRVAYGADLNEVEKVEVALDAKKIVDAQKPLLELEMSIQDLEEGLESVFRARTRNLNRLGIPCNKPDSIWITDSGADSAGTRNVSELANRNESSSKEDGTGTIVQRISHFTPIHLYNNLAGLKDLYECVEDYIYAHDGKCVEKVLDESIRLFYVRRTIKDVFSKMQQSVQDLQSSIRGQSNEGRKKYATNARGTL
ncbi:hypothetical protein C5167_013881 [Papaver somniferum]|uniref:Uncharacterized protein n=1 Tax=Papaver somniferum TaxID=3469 RepID=A0A4Y7J5M0_PAPSO|nr:hypothetical protein C5167_013881 [Papaver somniferum]